MIHAVRHLSAPGLARTLGQWHASGPAYVALADAVRSAVLAGTVAPLTRLPSERELAQALGLSRTTTAAAYSRLRDAGFVASKVGSGTVTTLPRGRATATAGASPVAGDAPPPRDTGLPTRTARHAVGAGRTPPRGPHGTVLTDLSQATPAATPALHDAYARALEALPAYLASGGYAHQGLDVLREAIAARYTARGVPTTPGQVLVTTGAQQAIMLLAQTYVTARETAVVESPTYVHAMEALRGAGGRLVGVPVGDVEVLESAVRRTRPRLVYLVPDHHNPTGSTLGEPERAAVRDIADRHGVTVVGDETLVDLTLDGATPAAWAGDGTSPRVVSVGSASKTYWGGLRVGWVRAEEQVVQRLARTRLASDVATAVLEQLVVVELLARHDELLPARLADLRERRDLLVGMLAEQLPDWRTAAPAGGLSLWIDLGRPVAMPLAAAAAAEGVLVQPGPAFTPDRTARDHLRLTFVRSPQELADAVPRLVRAWGRVTA